MKKVFVFFVAMFVMISATVAQVSVWDGTHSTWTQGTGTESNPYLIENAKQLAYLTVYINGGGASSGQYWKLIIDIDLNGLQWTPIGNDYYHPFSGHFYGDGHTIANLVVSVDYYAGLFGRISGGSMKDIGIIGSSSVSATPGDGNYAYAGGIVGDAEGNTVIDNCYNTGGVSSSSDLDSYAGGIVGQAVNVTINNCYNTGSVSSSNFAGGIFGYDINSTINNCYNTGGVSGYFVGGIAGYGNATINNCYNTGNILSFSGASACGISNGGNVNNSYYLDTSANMPGGGIPKTAEFMKTPEFVDLLNNGPTPNFAYKLDVSLVNGGYPIHSDFKLQTLSATNVAKTTATLNGTLDFGNTAVTQQGFIFDNNGIEETVYATISGNSVSYNISGLTANTTYQYKVFAISNSSTYWGDYEAFTTLPFNQSGTAFLIETQADLIRLANYVNGGNSYSGQEFILANDIDLPNTPNNILSIGTKETNCPFSGIFNGNGKHIRNVYIDNPNTKYQGFFGYTLNAHIKDLGLENITASGREFTGGMVGWAENTRLDVAYIDGGTLYALSYCGGLIGYQTDGTNSIVSGCGNYGCMVTGNNYVGGLIGYTYKGTVRNSYVSAVVTGYGTVGIGAIIGGSLDVLFYLCFYNEDITDLDPIGDPVITFRGGEGGMTSEQMRSPEFVKTLNQGLVTPAWKMDYNPPINNGFPILIWQTNLPPEAIEENTESSNIKVYPNPTTGQLIVACRDAINCVSTGIEVFDVFGRSVYIAHPPLRGGLEGLDISHLPTGIYFVRITTENGTVTRKVIKNE